MFDFRHSKIKNGCEQGLRCGPCIYLWIISLNGPVVKLLCPRVEIQFRNKNFRVVEISFIGGGDLDSPRKAGRYDSFQPPYRPASAFKKVIYVQDNIGVYSSTF